jgi:hypothetical protein
VANSAYGVVLDNGGARNTLSQLAIANISNYGLQLNHESNSKFAQLAIAQSGYNIYASHASNANNTFTKNLLIGNASTQDCYFTGNGMNAGLDSACDNIGASDATATSALDLSAAFVGKLTSDEATNSSDTNGTAAYVTTLDFYNFANAFRAWGRDGSSFPSSNNIGMCSAGTCAIWDWRLSSSDISILNTSGSGGIPNSSFTAASPCPSAVAGSYSLTDQNGHTYLANALELAGDNVGNDNGLCESSETCIYMPNFGVYQGEGTLTNSSSSSCTFTNGSVTGVTLIAYPTNGS